ncbi:hormogonium polysaccharide biosynthesis glycosyltransferase HpsE [Planktothrix sp. FACHB-1365]|uniref:hormogonium polysaccharide biosynthesis glycosyltransferase HpsE n=1 Tax=Planktothrix sp. FACHB-1365 TaxID=2692855 RepID=UPI001684D1F3|nr:hormogonium polysaccharide biosynthesis glycosyltransferase HpsE [Planktothrix sp. FACHB-1365]MBD2485439.1 glycosyltransferase family 2 protein [Planktothrix sp. FACHB-1365]
MIDFTVVIPTYNGASRVPDVLEKLRSQKGTENITWEIIVVDNNSSDQTANVIQDMIASWQEEFPLLYVLETQQGAAFARQRGLEEAQGELIGFLDDDNWPDENWVAQAYQFAQVYPQAGAYGGQIHGVYEVPPPENFKAIEGFLAIRERGPEPNRYQPQVLSLPPGAAMVVRKQVWSEVVPQQPQMSGKLPGGKMVQGDDWEPLMYLYKAGWEIWYNPSMHTYHQIPAWRLKRDYLLSLIQGSCLSFCPLRMIGANFYEKPIILVRTLFGNSYNAIRHYLKYQGQLKSNLIAECEMEIYLSRIRSFFYWMRLTLYP